MRKSKLTEEQMSYVLRQMEAGVPVAELARKYGVSDKTIYKWRERFGDMGAAEIRRVRQVEDENRKLKQLVADLSLDKQMLQEVI